MLNTKKFWSHSPWSAEKWAAKKEKLKERDEKIKAGLAGKQK